MFDLILRQTYMDALVRGIDLFDGRRRDQDGLAANPVARVDHEVTRPQPFVDQKVVDVANFTVSCKDVVAKQPAGLVQHKSSQPYPFKLIASSGSSRSSSV